MDVHAMSQRTIRPHGQRDLKQDKQLLWLPIDSRLIPDIFSFGQVKGLARVFLQIELTLTAIVVCMTIVLIVLRLLGLQ